MNNVISKAIDMIKTIEKISIVSHISPDGDNVGSILAMGLALRKLGKTVNIIKTDEIPRDYLFLPQVETIMDYDREDIELLIVLDCSDIDRLGELKDLVSKSKNTINIDHHVSNTAFADYNIVDSKAAATGELVYLFLNQMGIEIDEEIATCIYTAISTDTGSFMYESVTDNTHEIAADLLRKGIDKNNIVLKDRKSVV